jgi:hypothetical protein
VGAMGNARECAIASCDKYAFYGLRELHTGGEYQKGMNVLIELWGNDHTNF